MVTLRKLALILFLLSTVSGCAAASAGKYFEINDANRVKNGMTREEVIAIMGTGPFKISAYGKMLTWVYTTSDILGRTNTRAVTFSFDESGKTFGVPEDGIFNSRGLQKPQEIWTYEATANKIANKKFVAMIEPSSQYNDGSWSGFDLLIENKTDGNIEVVWDKSLFVINGQTNGTFMFEGVIYKDRQQSKPNDIIFAESRFKRLIFPNIMVSYQSGAIGWHHDSFSPGEYGVFLTLKVEGKEISEKLTILINHELQQL